MLNRFRPSAGTGHYAQHGAAVIKIGAVSLLGVLSSFGFQIVTARSLGPGDFGVLSAFFAIVTMASLASSSLQSAIAVETARALTLGAKPAGAPRIDGFTREALILGGAGAATVIAASPLIARSLQTEIYVPWLAAIAILLSFVFVRGIGVLQGSGDSQGAVWWSTIALIVRLVFVALAFALGLGLMGALTAVLVGLVVAVIGALLYAGRLNLWISHKPFQVNGVVVLLMTLLFAWLTNADVILVRAENSATDAGIYAAAAVLAKAVFLVPATLSLYLLPRFVRQEKDRELTRLGVRVTLAITGGGGVLAILFFATAGRWATSALLGSAYQIETGLLVGLAVAYLPWIMAHGLLIRMNALASRASVAILAAASGVLVAAGVVVLPNIAALLCTISLLGVAVLGSFVLIDHRHWLRVSAESP